MKTIYKIYKISLDPERRVVYVGMTSKHPGVRLYDLCGCNQQFKDAIEKYGQYCFSYDIIETIEDDKEEAFRRESYWTEYYSSISPLFNIGLGKNSQFSKTKEEMKDFYNQTLKPWIEENGGPNKGHKLSEEQKWKLAGVKYIPVKCIETDVSYPSINQAHRETGIGYQDIKKACESSTTAGGYHWNFILKENE